MYADGGVMRYVQNQIDLDSASKHSLCTVKSKTQSDIMQQTAYNLMAGVVMREIGKRILTHILFLFYTALIL